MGSGLACSQHGRHIAYTAGTGILVFLDIVAYLVIRIVDKYAGLGIGNVVETKFGNLHQSQTSNGTLRGTMGRLNYSERTRGDSMSRTY